MCFSRRSLRERSEREAAGRKERDRTFFERTCADQRARNREPISSLSFGEIKTEVKKKEAIVYVRSCRCRRIYTARKFHNSFVDARLLLSFAPSECARARKQFWIRLRARTLYIDTRHGKSKFRYFMRVPRCRKKEGREKCAIRDCVGRAYNAGSGLPCVCVLVKRETLARARAFPRSYIVCMRAVRERKSATEWSTFSFFTSRSTAHARSLPFCSLARARSFCRFPAARARAKTGGVA